MTIINIKEILLSEHPGNWEEIPTWLLIKMAAHLVECEHGRNRHDLTVVDEHIMDYHAGLRVGMVVHDNNKQKVRNMCLQRLVPTNKQETQP